MAVGSFLAILAWDFTAWSLVAGYWCGCGHRHCRYRSGRVHPGRDLRALILAGRHAASTSPKAGHGLTRAAGLAPTEPLRGLYQGFARLLYLGDLAGQRIALTLAGTVCGGSKPVQFVTEKSIRALAGAAFLICFIGDRAHGLQR